MKTVAYLVHAGHNTFNVILPGVSWEHTVPKASTEYGPIVCRDGLADATGDDGILDAKLVKVSVLSRKRPGCITLRSAEDVQGYRYIKIENDFGVTEHSLFKSTKEYVLNILMPRYVREVLHLKFTVLD